MKNKYVIVGKIGTSYGIKGWMKIHSFTEMGDGILDYSPWYLGSGEDDDWSEVVIEEGKIHGKGVIAKFTGFDSPEEARQLTSKMIAITEAQLPKLEKNEFYWSELEGLTVINKNGDVLGKVAYIMETGSNDVLVVKGETDHAIPYLMGSVILKVDLAKQEIHVDWEPL